MGPAAIEKPTAFAAAALDNPDARLGPAACDPAPNEVPAQPVTHDTSRSVGRVHGDATAP
jgi:hypothetical protein